MYRSFGTFSTTENSAADGEEAMDPSIRPAGLPKRRPPRPPGRPSEAIRLAKLAEFEAVMAEIEAEVGTPAPEQIAATENWVDGLLEEAERLPQGS